MDEEVAVEVVAAENGFEQIIAVVGEGDGGKVDFYVVIVEGVMERGVGGEIVD